MFHYRQKYLPNLSTHNQGSSRPAALKSLWAEHRVTGGDSQHNTIQQLSSNTNNVYAENLKDAFLSNKAPTNSTAKIHFDLIYWVLRRQAANIWRERFTLTPLSLSFWSHLSTGIFHKSFEICLRCHINSPSAGIGTLQAKVFKASLEK